jgi:nucleoid-associated protein YgaU
MKKLFTVVLVTVLTASIFAVSYKNNTYQKLADEYTKKAQTALDAGEYELSYEYAQKATENAELSKAYIQMMLARTDAENYIGMAKNQLAYAEKIDAEHTFPMAYTSAKENLDNALTSFESEDFQKAIEYAKACLADLDGIREVTPLPEFYIVRPWAETKDCYWNISGRPYVYNNPLLWENLYQANKDKMPKPEDPNLIHPGMKMKIPSLTGEYRKGTYDPKKEYETYGE